MKTLTAAEKITLTVFAVILTTALLTYIAYTYLPVAENANPPVTWGWGVDWKGTIRPGALDLISGRTPYTRVIRCLPPWIYLIVAPIAALPPALGTAFMFALTYVIYALVLCRLKVNPWAIAAFLLNSYLFTNARNGNVDEFAILGFILPPQIGLFFVLCKPQVGIGMAIYWAFEAWGKGKFRELLKVFAPVVIAYGLSFMVYGPWPLLVSRMASDNFNVSFWPVGLAIAGILLYKSIRSKDPLFSMGSGPFLSPYVNTTSLSVILFIFSQSPILMLIASILTWR